MKTQILDQLEQQIADFEKEHSFQVTQLENYRKVMRKASHVYEKVDKALKHSGLEIAKYHVPRFEVQTYSGKRRVWDTLKMSIVAKKAKNSKFRFLLFQGYTASGAGVNRPALQKKATKLEIKLVGGNSYRVGINPLSLEIKDVGTEGRVLVDVYVQ